MQFLSLVRLVCLITNTCPNSNTTSTTVLPEISSTSIPDDFIASSLTPETTTPPAPDDIPSSTAAIAYNVPLEVEASNEEDAQKLNEIADLPYLYKSQFGKLLLKDLSRQKRFAQHSLSQVAEDYEPTPNQPEGSFCKFNPDCASNCCVRHQSGERRCRPLSALGDKCTLGQLKGGLYSEFCPCAPGEGSCKAVAGQEDRIKEDHVCMADALFTKFK